MDRKSVHGYLRGTDLSVRFWARVDRRGESECWPWLGSITDRGYGRLKLTHKAIQAHRLSYQLANGVSLDSSVVVRHSCDNPACVNPSHLLTGTYADNRADCVARGRVAKGVRHGKSRLTAEAVIRIKTSPLTCAELARQLGVNWSTVDNVRKGATWAHVEVSHV